MRKPIFQRMASAALALMPGLISSHAWATGLPTIPEPDVLGLLAIGAAAGAVIWVRNRRNKK